MSGSGGGGKFNPKNLHYDRSATLPPFLARLHAQHAPGNFDGPDPILAARRRPTKKPRSGSEEAEDAPLVLDEQGNVVDTVSVGRDGTVMERSGAGVEGEGTKEGEEGEEGDRNKDGEEGSKEGNHKRAVQEEKGVEIGASRKKKKRKIGKVIGGDAGGDDSDQEQEQEQDGHDGKPKGKKTEGTDAKDQSRKTEESLLGGKPKPTKTTTKKKTTAKKIKLSFGDGDEEG
ncbi:hypothetical protein GE21DRAFT_1352239 [Neurospora crassa]|nr:hypothetical protein GE21DRAFT_1352239 [Neurospora crassa]